MVLQAWVDIGVSSNSSASVGSGDDGGILLSAIQINDDKQLTVTLHGLQTRQYQDNHQISKGLADMCHRPCTSER